MSYKQKTKSKIIDSKVFNKLEKYVKLIELNNLKNNLTKFRGDQIWQEGIYESVFLLENTIENPNDKLLLDIGSGIGFPSIPYLIVYPKIKLTIYEPKLKRYLFLKSLIQKLNLNFQVIKIRVEDSKEIDKFNFITARAVAKFKHLLQASFHLGKIKAKFIFIKGPKAQTEIKAANELIKLFQINPKIIDLKIKNKLNKIICFQKLNPTPPGYPKKWSQIIK